ncbi:MAG: FAD-dependent oxidoreductase [Sphingobacteriales bacterium]|nr:FAD-dependent oxidoreductase [Sphingobacteriales bacterium]OJW03120.1 MAG: xanthan lyase [Sphingobacteriales bacterium 44-61]
MKYLGLVLFALCNLFFVPLQKIKVDTIKADICIYGGNASGVIAAYTAARMNKKVILIEPGFHLGGLTTGGLGYTDIGNKYAITGLSLDVYRRIGKHYGKFEQWIFEPGVAENVMKQYIQEAGIQVIYGYRVEKVEKNGSKLSSITVQKEDGSAQKVNARMFIDCSYEGDVMARAGVSYMVGREANSLYKETYNGIQVLEGHQFPDGIDPYKIPGDPNSGLIWGVSNGKLAETGAGDKKVQAYNFRICLTNKPENRVPITRPDNYDSTRYELLLRYLQKKIPGDLWGFLKFDLMPNNKTDINNNGPISTDMIGYNYNYPDADYETRKKIQKEHEDYTKGLLFFIGHDQRMPEHLRNQMLQWGYPKDEYTDNGNWTPQMYVREARRMVGAYVMTQHNCEGREVVDDGVGVAAYTMDSHNCQRIVVNGMVKNEGNVEIGGFGPYPISYRSLIPKKGECDNLLVPVCLSASHIAYGSIRMEPVFMVLGQSAAIAASLAMNNDNDVHKVDVKKVQEILKKDPLMNGKTPEVLVDNEDRQHVSIKGSWQVLKKGAYGHSMLIDSSKGKSPKSIQYIPALTKAGAYQVYIYIPKVKEMTSQMTINISTALGMKNILIKPAEIIVEGQTSGEWVSLGTHSFTKDKKSFVEISNAGADGYLPADAILFIPQ